MDSFHLAVVLLDNAAVALERENELLQYCDEWTFYGFSSRENERNQQQVAYCIVLVFYCNIYAVT